MTTTGTQLWDKFVATGGTITTDIYDGVAALSAEAIANPSTRGHLYHFAQLSFSLASQALLMGSENIAQLALVCERCFDHMGDGAVRGEEALARLAAAARTLRQAFEQLANPDKSGARVEGLPIEAARQELEEVLPERTAPGEMSSRAARAAAVVARSATATATMAAAAAAKSAAALASAASGPPPAVDASTLLDSGPPPPAPPLATPTRARASAETIPPPVTEEDDRIWEPEVDEDMIDLFFEEANDRVGALAEKLVELEQRPEDAELVREIFRDLHTVKGSSGMVGLRRLNKLAHTAEDLVGQLRDGDRKVDGPVIDALLAALDGLRDILALAQARQPIDVAIAPVVDRLRNPGATPAPADVEVDAPAPEAAPTGTGARAPALAARQTIRVDFDKLDLLMNLVGELVLGRDELHGAISSLGSLSTELASERQLTRRLAAARKTRVGAPDPRAPLLQLGEEIGRVERVMTDIAGDLDHASGRLDSISDQLRDQVMKLRMVPIGGIFRKHHRTVRDLANAMGKQARLELSGEDTELDKVLVELLDEPLMHLVRNAVDHGVEAPHERIAAGKAALATVQLRAMHRGNQVIIEIRDDGGGIDPAAIRARALDKEICTQDELDLLDDKQVLEILFRPGFSTAAQVSEISGRGVGMDVVWSTIVNKLKGQVEIESEIGAGSTFRLRLPLTLAIIQVLLARAGGEVFAIPLDSIIRTITRNRDQVALVQDREVIAVRSRQVPLIRLANVLELVSDHHSQPDVLHIVLVEVAGETYGLACDHLLGKKEIVIKSLADMLQDVPCAAGATLLGDRCALILDVPAIVQRAMRTPGITAPPPRARRGASRDTSPPVTGAPRILLVEDSDMVREQLRRLLVDAGYNVTPARDGVEGMEKARGETFDLVSTDVMMPRMDGYELTRALRGLPAYRDVPIIMVTSRGERIDRVRGFDAGVDEYITKPHDRASLRRVVARLLASRPHHDEHGGDA